MIKIIKDFKDFAVKGNMIDIAIGVIIGSAFNKVVDVLVKEVFLPPLNLLTGGLNWADKKVIIQEKTVSELGALQPEVSIGYGKLFEASVDFLIISITVFIVVKMFKQVRDKAEDPKDPEVQTPKDIELLDRIADSLERQEKLLSSMRQ
jgi:large conductance mechanosensitive channel